MTDAAFIKKQILTFRKSLAIKEHELEKSKELMQSKHGTDDIDVLLKEAESIEENLKANEAERERLIQEAEVIIEEIQEVG